MNTLPLYTRTIFAFLTLILSLSLIHDNYTASADETSKCEQARTLLKKLQSREKGFSDSRKRWFKKLTQNEKTQTSVEMALLECELNPPVHDRAIDLCKDLKSKYKKSTTNILQARKEIEWMNGQIKETKGKQTKLIAIVNSKNCTVAKKKRETEESPGDTAEYGVKRTYRVDWKGKNYDDSVRITWVAYNENTGRIDIYFRGEGSERIKPLALMAHKESESYVARDKDGLVKRVSKIIDKYPKFKKWFVPSLFENIVIYIKPTGQNLDIIMNIPKIATLNGIAYPIQ